MGVDDRAGQPAAQSDLVDVARLVTAYYAQHPDSSAPEQRVAFGTSGHRGSALRLTFNDDHIAATAQAICEYRAQAGISGPLYMGRDTHALSEPAFVTALEVLAANDVRVLVDSRDGYTPTPAVSRAILAYNEGRAGGLADGIVVTPSHNPPEDGGFKYNPPDGGPAGAQITSAIQDRANELLRTGLAEVRRIPYARAKSADTTGSFDFLGEYVAELPAVVDTDAVRAARVRIGADPLGGASVAYWAEIADRFGLDLTVVNPVVDATFRFMTLDWDGRIRMDCSSPYAMASLIARRTEFAIATGNDTDADRHGIVTPDAGLIDPNHYLAVAIDYLYRHRDGWPADAAVGILANHRLKPLDSINSRASSYVFHHCLVGRDDFENKKTYIDPEHWFDGKLEIWKTRIHNKKINYKAEAKSFSKPDSPLCAWDKVWWTSPGAVQVKIVKKLQRVSFFLLENRRATPTWTGRPSLAVAEDKLEVSIYSSKCNLGFMRVNLLK